MTDQARRMQLWKDMGGSLTEKEAELAGTYDMPWSESAKTNNDPKKNSKTVIQKTAAATEDAVLQDAFGCCDNENDSVKGETPDAPQAKVLKPTVDVSSHEPPKLIKEKTASRYALPSQQRYPLDGYNQVKTASVYFDEWHPRMSPEVKREFCQNMVKRAHELGIKVSELAEQYGAEGYAPPHHIKIAMDARRTVLHNDVDLDVLDKLAEAQPTFLPDTFAEALAAFDHATGLDEFYGGDVPDPYFSTFAKTGAVAGVKQEDEVSPDESLLVGNEYLPVRKLVTFAKLGKDTVVDRFGEELAEALVKDPVGIFNSLPRDQKLVLMRLASAVDAQNQSASVS